MLQDRGSDESRDVNQTIDFQPVPSLREQQARKWHVLVAASSNETRVEQYGSGRA